MEVATLHDAHLLECDGNIAFPLVLLGGRVNDRGNRVPHQLDLGVAGELRPVVDGPLGKSTGDTGVSSGKASLLGEHDDGLISGFSGEDHVRSFSKMASISSW